MPSNTPQPDCGHYFHDTTASGFCPRCGGSWKRRHRRERPRPNTPGTVTVTLHKTTDEVVWTGGDGKPRCARHPFMCLVRATAVGITAPPDQFVCARCWKEARRESWNLP